MLEQLEDRSMLTAVISAPDPWYVGQTNLVTGTGFGSNKSVDLKVFLSDSSIVTDHDWSNSSGVISENVKIDGDAPGGTATIRAYINNVEVASDTFMVIADPTLHVPSTINAAGSSFYVDGTGFLEYQGEEDIYLDIIQGEYRWEWAVDSVIDSDGEVRRLLSVDEDDWFTGEATFISRLDDGTILSSVTVDIINGEGSAPTFTAEITPDINITTPQTFREGDTFTITLLDGVDESAVGIQVIGDNDVVEHDFGIFNTDTDGEASITLRMPLVLDQGFSVDGRTISVSHGGYTEDFPVTLNEGIRFGLNDDTPQEGQTVDAEIRNGIGESQVIFQIVHDDDLVVHEFGFMETDGSGYGEFQLTIPTILDPGFSVDGYTLRAIHGGVVIDKSLTITEGLRVVAGARNVRETHTFHVEVRNGTPNTAVTMAWWHDDTFVQNHSGSYSTNGSGYADFTLTMPDLIQNAADSDLFTLKVTHNGNTFELDITVYQSQTPDPGDPLSDGLVNGNGSNSIPTTSILGLAQLSNSGATLAQIHALIDSAFEGNEDFYRVLGWVSGSIAARQPLDQVDIDDLIAPLTVNNFSNLTPLISGSGGDYTFQLKERSKHQLVILIHGSDQTNGDGNSAGMNIVYNKLFSHVAGGHIMRLESGSKYASNPTLSADLAFLAAQDEVAATISLLNGLGHTIESVVIAGYSWGGGMARRLADWIDDEYSGAIEIAGLAYVDAVNHGNIGVETDLPSADVSSILNIYQSEKIDNFDFVAAGNGSISNPGLGGFDGTEYYGRFRQIDTDFYGNTTSHTTIDEVRADDVAEFIKHVLDEWYWDDLLS
jgi:hypothetical protein